MEKLSTKQVAQFINQGFVKLDDAFPEEIAKECCKLLWAATKCDPQDPGTWTEPVIRISELPGKPFIEAANTTLLHNAFDQLVGKGNWKPRTTLGSFPIRFPVKQQPADTGWHVDASFSGNDVNNYFDWRINIRSRGRALLMLFLFSDVGEQDAPTRIRAGSHLDIAQILQRAGDEGLTFMELAQKLELASNTKIITATGKAGTVYLCHPFIVHAAQAHHGHVPKFMAQPPLLSVHDFNLERAQSGHCPVELAILKALA